MKPSPRKLYTELLLSPNGLGWIQRGALHSFKAHQRKEVTCYYGTWWGRQGRTKTRCHGVNGAQEPGLARQAGFRRPRLDSRPNGRNTGCPRPLDTHLHAKSRVQNTTPDDGTSNCERRQWSSEETVSWYLAICSPVSRLRRSCRQSRRAIEIREVRAAFTIRWTLCLTADIWRGLKTLALEIHRRRTPNQVVSILLWAKNGTVLAKLDDPRFYATSLFVMRDWSVSAP